MYKKIYNENLKIVSKAINTAIKIMFKINQFNELQTKKKRCLSLLLLLLEEIIVFRSIFS